MCESPICSLTSLGVVGFFLFNFSHPVQSVVFHLILVHIPVMTHEVEHLFMQSFVICILLWSICSYLLPIFKRNYLYNWLRESILNTSQICTLYIFRVYALPVYFPNNDFIKKINVHTVKYTIFSKSSLIFDKQLHNNTYNQDVEQFYHPSVFFHPLNSEPLLPLLASGNHWSIFCPYSFDFSNVSYKWDHVICSFLNLASLT